MKSSYQFKIDPQMHKQVDLEHQDETLIVRIVYRVGNSVTTKETQIAVVGIPRSTPNAHGINISYRQRPFPVVPWLTIPRSRFF